MTTFRTLHAIPATTLMETFNAAFADYVIPFAMTNEDLQAKITSENISLELSAGMFSGERLVGFILIGTDETENETVAYNAGTGVIPEFRGQHLTEKMYGSLFPMLAEKGIRHHQLEVITQNEKAVRVYEKIGFRKHRTVNCFKGNIIAPARDTGVAIMPIGYPIPESGPFRDFSPTFQNSGNTILRAKGQHRFLGAFLNEKLVGFVVFSEANARIKQFGVTKDFRRKRIGHQLFYEVQKIVGNRAISLINVDGSYSAGIDFLQNIGLAMTVRQFEMDYVFEG